MNITESSILICKGKCTDNINKRISLCRSEDLEHFNGFFNSSVTQHKFTDGYINGLKCIALVPQPLLTFIFTSNTDYKSMFYDLQSLQNVLSTKQNVITQPIYCTIYNKSHVMLLIINKSERSVNIFDPNCEHLYSSLYANSIREELLKLPVPLVILKLSYPKNVKLNCTYNFNKNGVCVQIMLLMSFELLRTKMSCQKILEKFSKLSKEVFEQRIICHSLFYYSIISHKTLKID